MAEENRSVGGTAASGEKDFADTREDIIKSIQEKQPDIEVLYDLAELLRCSGIPPGSGFCMPCLRRSSVSMI